MRIGTEGRVSEWGSCGGIILNRTHLQRSQSEAVSRISSIGLCSGGSPSNRVHARDLFLLFPAPPPRFHFLLASVALNLRALELVSPVHRVDCLICYA